MSIRLEITFRLSPSRRWTSWSSASCSLIFRSSSPVRSATRSSTSRRETSRIDAVNSGVGSPATGVIAISTGNSTPSAPSAAIRAATPGVRTSDSLVDR
jgi:hypothetical protein